MFKFADSIPCKPGRLESDPSPEEFESRINNICAFACEPSEMFDGKPDQSTRAGVPLRTMSWDDRMAFCEDYNNGWEYKLLIQKYGISEHLIRRFRDKYKLAKRRAH